MANNLLNINRKVLFLALIAVNGLALKIRHFDVPSAVSNGRPLVLHCDYDLEGKDLSCVKFLKDYIEFYRFCPHKCPHQRVFQVNGIDVDSDGSNDSHVHLSEVDLHSDGIYICEVSVSEAPERTVTVRSERLVRVYVLPDPSVTITGQRDHYQINDRIELICSSGYARPLPALVWYINDELALDEQLVKYPAQVNNGLQSNQLGITLRAIDQYLNDGKLNLTCKSVIGMIDEFETTKWIVNGTLTQMGFFSTYWSAQQTGSRGPPTITGLHQQYRAGDVLTANCSSGATDATLTWLVDDRPVTLNKQIVYNSNVRGNAVLGINLTIKEQNINSKGLKIKCIAHIPQNIATFDKHVEISVVTPVVAHNSFTQLITESESTTEVVVYTENSDVVDEPDTVIDHHETEESVTGSVAHIETISPVADSIGIDETTERVTMEVNNVSNDLTTSEAKESQLSSTETSTTSHIDVITADIVVSTTAEPYTPTIDTTMGAKQELSTQTELDISTDHTISEQQINDTPSLMAITDHNEQVVGDDPSVQSGSVDSVKSQSSVTGVHITGNNGIASRFKCFGLTFSLAIIGFNLIAVRIEL